MPTAPAVEPNPAMKLSTMSPRRHRRDGAQHGRAEHQRQERVELAPGDEQDDGEDAEERGDDELASPAYRLSAAASGDGVRQQREGCIRRAPSVRAEGGRARSRTCGGAALVGDDHARLVGLRAARAWRAGWAAGRRACSGPGGAPSGRRMTSESAVTWQEPHVGAALAQEVAVDPAQRGAGDDGATRRRCSLPPIQAPMARATASGPRRSAGCRCASWRRWPRGGRRRPRRTPSPAPSTSPWRPWSCPTRTPP